MRTELIDLASDSPGLRQQLRVQHYGDEGGTGPRAVIQAALHADEIPPLLVAQALAHRLAALETQGQLRGSVSLVPCANPVGLAQRVLDQPYGRFDLHDGVNFNRGYADLCEALLQRAGPRLTGRAAVDTALVRDVLREAAGALPAVGATQDLKRRLLQNAIGADVVLDLHCDGEAVMHLYALTPQADLAAELGALLGAQAVLLATESGDGPFDEACTRPWLALQQHHPLTAPPLGCFSATVELRGQADTHHALAAQDADAIVEFLRRRGVVAGDPAPLPPPLCAPTPLAASEPITAPTAGILVLRQRVGDDLQAGDTVADLVDIDDGRITPLVTRGGGRLYATAPVRWARPGQRIAQVAGTTLVRVGKLLSP